MKNQSKSEAETQALAARIAGDIRPGDIILLRGSLGAGKSVFARALIRTLMQNGALEVPSPTFTLVQTYDAPQGIIYHYDLYRLETAEELYELGWEDAQGEGISLVEWPERLGTLKPLQALDIEIKASENDPSHRKILIKDTRSR